MVQNITSNLVEFSNSRPLSIKVVFGKIEPKKLIFNDLKFDFINYI